MMIPAEYRSLTRQTRCPVPEGIREAVKPKEPRTRYVQRDANGAVVPGTLNQTHSNPHAQQQPPYQRHSNPNRSRFAVLNDGRDGINNFDVQLDRNDHQSILRCLVHYVDGRPLFLVPNSSLVPPGRVRSHDESTIRELYDRLAGEGKLAFPLPTEKLLSGNTMTNPDFDTVIAATESIKFDLFEWRNTLTTGIVPTKSSDIIRTNTRNHHQYNNNLLGGHSMDEGSHLSSGRSYHHYGGQPQVTHAASYDDLKWEYIDLNGDKQGPFTQSDMKSWCAYGYFNNNDIRIRVYRGDEDTTEFKSLSYFWGPNTADAFVGLPVILRQRRTVARAPPGAMDMASANNFVDQVAPVAVAEAPTPAAPEPVVVAKPEPVVEAPVVQPSTPSVSAESMNDELLAKMKQVEDERAKLLAVQAELEAKAAALKEMEARLASASASAQVSQASLPAVDKKQTIIENARAHVDSRAVSEHFDSALNSDAEESVYEEEEASVQESYDEPEDMNMSSIPVIETVDDDDFIQTDNGSVDWGNDNGYNAPSTSSYYGNNNNSLNVADSIKKHNPWKAVQRPTATDEVFTKVVPQTKSAKVEHKPARSGINPWGARVPAAPMALDLSSSAAPVVEKPAVVQKAEPVQASSVSPASVASVLSNNTTQRPPQKVIHTASVERDLPSVSKASNVTVVKNYAYGHNQQASFTAAPASPAKPAVNPESISVNRAPIRGPVKAAPTPVPLLKPARLVQSNNGYDDSVDPIAALFLEYGINAEPFVIDLLKSSRENEVVDFVCDNFGLDRGLAQAFAMELDDAKFVPAAKAGRKRI